MINFIFLFFRIDFDPNKFQKPLPYYGLIHDKYIVSSENQGIKPKLENKKTFLNSNMNANAGTQGATTVNTNFNQARTMKDSVGGPKR